MGIVRDVGSWGNSILDGAGFTSHLLLGTLRRVHHLPRRWRFFMDQAYTVGVRALPVTSVVALFAGMILALQTGIELQRLGQGSMIGTVTALSMCREMGPFMTALILAATVGSSMAAEIGTMKVSEEVTALDVMSVDTTSYLVVPRVVALTIMCPIMTVISNLIGIFGGSIVAANKLSVSTEYYWITVHEALSDADNFLPKDVYTGLAKAIVFGCMIAIVSCSTGLRASGGALGVGRAVQQAVKTSVLLIIVLGYVLTWFFYFLIQ
ncbi:MAG: ABC transporter permease [Planctomycetota bacterium]|nr:ABC transporter permease [Planctomycetota bacterium]